MTGTPWPTVPLGQVLQLRRPDVTVDPTGTYPFAGVYCFGRGVFRGQERQGSEFAYRTLTQLREGDFVYPKLMAWEGAFGVVPAECGGCFVSPEFPAFQVQTDRLASPFLGYYFRLPAVWEMMAGGSIGTNVRRRRLHPYDLLRNSMPLPPLPEQRRIVAKLDQLSAKVEEARAIQRRSVVETEILRRSVLATAFANLSPVGTLGDVLTDRPRNGWSVRCDNAETGTPVLSLSAVTGFHYDGKAFKRTSATTNPAAHYWLTASDLLITRSNTPELVGHAAIYTGTPAPCIYPDLMMRIPLDTCVADVLFAWLWLQTHTVREFIRHRAKGTSASMKKISQGTVMRIPFPTNVPLPAQRQVVARLQPLRDALAPLSVGQARSAAAIDALMPSILARAFMGEL